ncbi:hypothetical protein [Pseudoalteromonas sp. C8]|uniref:hypothetical protein n=1 Tax=Pseudoalteromonas sp. C8 TaxID=2686345 RepID=UPI0013FE4ADB|nr:hypothetical protein [Pseudoalteromonas sp. C8]
MKLVIHIGTEKTGTSSLQLWGAQNRQPLQEAGVYYSKLLGEVDHRKASVYPLTHGVSDDGFERYNISNNDEFTAFKTQLELDFKNEVEFAKSLNCSHFIVSSEHLHSRIITKEMVESVKALFAPHFSDDDMQILCYVRPQADLFQSRLSVGVRNLTHSKAEVENLWKNESVYFNYYDLWQRWAAVFSHVTFKPFNKHKNVIEDLANILGISLSDYTTPARVNEKLDYRMGLIGFNLRNVIRTISMKKELLNLYFEQIECKEPITISRALASKINAFYRESNIAFCKANSHFLLTDIEADFKKFAVEGSADKMFEENETIAFLVQILIRNYCDINLLHCDNEFLKIERALARGNVKNAAGFKLKLLSLLAKFDDMNFESKYNLKHVSAKVDSIKTKLQTVKV